MVQFASRWRRLIDGRSDIECDQTDVETASFEAERFLGITKP